MTSIQLKNESTIGSSRPAHLFVALLVAIGLLLRCWHLTDKALWLDEIWSITVAKMPWSSLPWSLYHHDPNMGLYHAILHLWLNLSSNEFFIRLLSALFGAATLPVVYILGKLVFDIRVGLLACLLFTINLFHIEYSQETRSYSLWVFLCTITTLLFFRYIARGKSIDWILYCFFAILSIYAHIYAFLVIAAHVGSLAFLDRRPPRRSLLAGLLAIGAFSLPLLFLIYQRIRAPFVPLGWVPRPSIRRVYDLFYALSGNANFYGIEVTKLPSGKILLVVALSCLLLTFIPVVRQVRMHNKCYETWRQVYLFFCLFVPIFLALVISLRMPLFLNRYFLICLPALCVLTAKGLTMLRRRWLFASVLSMVLLCEAGAIVQYFRYRAQYGEWKTATSIVLSQAMPGDAIVFSMAHGRLLFDFYTRSYRSPLRNVDEIYPDLSLAYIDPKALGYYPVPSEGQLSSLSSHRRVWLLLYPSDLAPSAPVSRLFQDRLSQQFSDLDVRRIDAITICLYSRRKPAAIDTMSAVASSPSHQSQTGTTQLP